MTQTERTDDAHPPHPLADAVIVAGGGGLRFGGPIRKQYREIGGVPVLLRAIRPFLASPRVARVVVVLPAADAAHPPAWLRGLPVDVVPGGAERGDSVRAGLAAASSPIVLVHDGARPFVSGVVIDRVLDACADGGAAVAAVPVTDTIQEVDEDGVITRTPERARLRQAQTPQGFPRRALMDAYRRAGDEGIAATDDAAVYARFIGQVRTVMGSHDNLKVTRPEDLPLAEAIARRADAAT